MVSQTLQTDFHFYQSANADAEKIKNNFLIRVHEYEVIIDDIRRNPMKGSVQHYLLIGRRGSGKSTLIKRLQVEIDTDKELSKTHVAVNLAEEQANIYKLYDLLEGIIDELNFNNIAVEQPEWEDNMHAYSRKLFAAIHGAIEQSGKKVVLLLDNIDRIFENLQEDAALLREYLLNYDDIKIVGGSTRMTEHFWKYNKPFYEFFRVLELKPLSSIEIRTLLLNWSERLNLPELKDFVEDKPGQLETIRILTDGLPRTFQFFVNILLTRTQETSYEYLRLIMDSVTPLYQERLNTLPPSQRKIVLQMAFIWESAGAKEIAEATKMDSKVISAQLKQLIDKGIAERIATKTKNHLYRLSERFFNLWLIFTQGSPKEKRKAKYLTIFLENFYDAEELNNIAIEHLKALESGSINSNSAALLTKAYAQSKYIDSILRDLLINRTLELKNVAEDLKEQLPETSKKIFEEVKELVAKVKYNEGIKKAELIEQEDGLREYILGMIFEVSDKTKEAKLYLDASLKKGYAESAFFLGNLYYNSQEYEKAKQYYDQTAQLGYNAELVANSILMLAEVYFHLGGYNEAERLFSEAIDKGKEEAILRLGSFYLVTDRKELAERNFKIAIEKKIPLSSAHLAFLYYYNNIDKAKAVDLLEAERNYLDINEYNSAFEALKIKIDAWTGNFKKLKIEVELFTENGDLEDFDDLIEDLLIHHQTNLCYKIFIDSKFSQEIRERFLPLYYATLVILSKEYNAKQKIPPELQDTVSKILEDIREQQDFYYGEKKELA